MKRLTSLLLSFALCPTVEVAAQGCQTTVEQAVSSHGIFCTWFRYCYTVCVPNGCLPVWKVCIDFADVSVLSADSAPPGWTIHIDPVTSKVCWTLGAFGSPILGGDCKTFCVQTSCWPSGIEGIQQFNVNDSNAAAHSGDTHYAPALIGLLNADGPGNLGATRTISVRDPRNPGGLGLAFVSLQPASMPVPGLGDLLIDPNLAAYWAALPVDGLGRGQAGIQVPPDPGLLGLVLYFQSLQVPDAHLSGQLVFPVL